VIIAIAGLLGDAARSVLATNLAVLRAREGRKICLVDTDPKRAAFTWSCARSAAGISPSIPARTLAQPSLSVEIEQMQDRYNDILINTEARDTHMSRSALIAARVVLVPLERGQANLDTEYAMVARLNAARMFNPSLRVLFVIVGSNRTATNAEDAAMRAYVAHVMSATLAATVIHAPWEHHYGQGRCLSDAETCDPDTAAEMHALYHEVFHH
jgi:chromosome partitioning protein